MKSYLKVLPILIIVLLSLISTAYATSYAPPKAKKIYSLDNHYFIDFNPDKKTQQVMKVINNTDATYAWSFSYDIEYGDELFVSNNGMHVLIVRSKFVITEDLHKPAVLIFNSNGLQTKFTYSQLSTPRKYHDREIGPIGESWRVWRENKILISTDGLLHIKTENHSRDILFNLNSTDRKNNLLKKS